MERTSHFDGNEMTIIHSERIKTVTCLNTGETKVYKDDEIKNTWPDLPISEFERKQNEIQNAAEVLNEFKV